MNSQTGIHGPPKFFPNCFFLILISPFLHKYLILQPKWKIIFFLTIPNLLSVHFLLSKWNPTPPPHTHQGLPSKILLLYLLIQQISIEFLLCGRDCSIRLEQSLYSHGTCSLDGREWADRKKKKMSGGDQH